MRRVLKPKWWTGHLLVVAAVLVMLRLGQWQFDRATGPGGGIQNYAYAAQWPLFAVFAVVLWVRTLLDEVRRDPAVEAEQARRRAAAAALATRQVLRRDGFVVGVSASATTLTRDDDDPEVAAWNSRLARLNAIDAALDAGAAGRQR